MECNQRIVLRKWLRIWYAVLVFAALTSGCQLTEPDTHETKQYIYVASDGVFNGEYGIVLVIDVNTNTVVDSILGFNNEAISTLAIARESEKLYACTFNRVLYSVDLKTQAVNLISSNISNVYVTPDETVLAVSSESYIQTFKPIGILDKQTDVITYVDTLDILAETNNQQGIVFDETRPLLYAVNSNGQLFAYDYDQREIVRVYENIRGSLYHLLISSDGKRLFEAGGFVYDLENDSVLVFLGGNQVGSLAFDSNEE